MTELSNIWGEIRSNRQRLNILWEVFEVTKQKAIEHYERLKEVALEKNFKPGWIYYRMKDRYGAVIADIICNSEEKENKYEEPTD